MRRTGILTFQKANNHGALMQAYALQESLRAGGDEVTVIDYTSPSMRSTQYHDAIFDGFREQYLNISRPVRAEEIKNLGLDRVVIGSDQVWNPNITGEDATYFLPKELRGTIQVLSYAASLGIQNPEIKEKAAFYRANLKDHAKISLREEGNAETLYEVLKALPGGYAGEITAHIDPTLLLDQEDYEKLAQKEPVEDGGYIFYFSYNTDPRLLDFVNLCSAHTGLPVVASSGFGPAKFLSNALVRNRMTPPEWLAAIRDATFVITDSYHGLMLSLIFRKAFYVYTLDCPGAVRLMDVLKRYGLKERRICALSSLKELREDVDYSTLSFCLKKEREKAFAYLYE